MRLVSGAHVPYLCNEGHVPGYLGGGQAGMRDWVEWCPDCAKDTLATLGPDRCTVECGLCGKALFLMDEAVEQLKLPKNWIIAGTRPRK